MGEAVHVWGQEGYEKSLCFLVSFVVNLNILQERKFINLKNKEAGDVPLQ